MKINLTKLLEIKDRVILINYTAGTTGDNSYIQIDIGTSAPSPYSFELED